MNAIEIERDADRLVVAFTRHTSRFFRREHAADQWAGIETVAPQIHRCNVLIVLDRHRENVLVTQTHLAEFSLAEPRALGAETDLTLDRKPGTLDQQVLHTAAILALAVIGEAGSGLGRGGPYPADGGDAHVGLMEVSGHIDPALGVSEVVNGGLDADGPTQEAAEINADLLSLLAIEIGLDDGGLLGIRTGGTLPREDHGNTLKLGFAAGLQRALVHRQVNRTVGNVDAGQRILEPGVGDPRRGIDDDPRFGHILDERQRQFHLDLGIALQLRRVEAGVADEVERRVRQILNQCRSAGREIEIEFGKGFGRQNIARQHGALAQLAGLAGGQRDACLLDLEAEVVVDELGLTRSAGKRRQVPEVGCCHIRHAEGEGDGFLRKPVSGLGFCQSINRKIDLELALGDAAGLDILVDPGARLGRHDRWPQFPEQVRREIADTARQPDAGRFAAAGDCAAHPNAGVARHDDKVFDVETGILDRRLADEVDAVDRHRSLVRALCINGDIAGLERNPQGRQAPLGIANREYIAAHLGARISDEQT